MSNRKNYNSIVFLTTLGVYLGLVLAGGATPTVLAQAALTRDFDIKNEVVLEDDLDKKPDDEVYSQLKRGLDQSDKQFIEQYAKTILALLGRNYAPQAGDHEITFKGSYPALENDAFFNGFFPSLRKEPVIDSFVYTLDKDKLFGKLNLKSRFKNDISPAGYSFAAGLDSRRRASLDQSANTVLKNTRITFENDQVFIVTRLPRASIDDLLAKNNAR